MAGRVNTRFVIILVLVLTALVGATAAAYLVFSKRDPAKHFAQGQSLETRAEEVIAEGGGEMVEGPEGERMTLGQKLLRDAAEQYRYAYKFADSGDADLKKEVLRKLAHVYRQYRVEDIKELNEWISAVEQVWGSLLKIDATDQEAREALLAMTEERAELSGGRVQAWNQLYNQADEAVDLVEEPAIVRRYRGIAHVARLGSLQIRDEQAFAEARADLETAAEAFPDDAEVFDAKARLKLIEADAKAGRVSDEEIAALRDASLTILDEFIASHPENLEGRLSKYQMLIRRYTMDRGNDQWRERAMAVLDDLEQRCLKADDADMARRVAEQVRRLDNSVGEVDGERVRMGLHRAEQLLRHAVQTDPQDVLALTTLGEVLREQGRVDDAIEVYKLAAEPGRMPIEVRSLLTGQLKLNAMRRLVELHIARFETSQRAGENEAADQAVADARQWVEALRTEAGEQSPLTQFAEGQLALAEGNDALAVRRLEEAAAQYDQPNADVLRTLATALTRRGQHGEAAMRLTQVLETPEGRRQPAVYLQLAMLHLRNGEPREAMPLIDRILEFAPENGQAIALKARATMMSARNPQQMGEAFDEAIALLEANLEAGGRPVVVQYAQLLRRDGRTDEAIAALEKYHAANPEDMGVLQLLVGMDLASDNRQRAVARIDKAAEANPDDPALRALRLAVDEEVSGEQRMEQAEALLEEEQDPVARQLALYRLYSNSGQTEKAAEALAAVEKLDPDHAGVRELRLSQAIQEQRWEDAEQIVNWAKAANDGAGADYAGGAFWEGRLLLAREQAERAVATLRRGVEQMPSDSTGRLLLGMALMQTGDLNAAERELERSIEIKPDNQDAWVQLHRVQHRRGNYQAALDSLRSAIQRTGGRTNAALLSRFIDYTGQYGDPDVAINAREQLAERMPDDLENRRKLARLYYEADRLEEAHATIDALLSDPPTDRENVAAKAFLLVADDRVEEARAVFEKFIHATEGNEQDARNWLAFAQALSSGGEYGLADATYRRAVEVDDSEQLVALRQYADWLMSRQQYADAAERYGEILGDTEGLDERVVDAARRRYAESVMRTGEFDKAEEQIDTLIADSPRDGQLHLLRAMIAQGRGAQEGVTDAQREELRAVAERSVEQAVRLLPTSPTAHLMWAQLHFDDSGAETRQFVREHLETAIELNPSQPVAHRLLVRWHQRAGNIEAAIEAQEAMVAAMPDSAEARVQLAELYLAHGEMNTRLDQLLTESERQLPGQPAWPQLRARMLQAQGRIAQAMEQMRTAYQRDASPGRTIELLDLMVRAGAHQQALALLNERPELVRQSAVVQAMRGRALCGIDRYEPGVNSFRAAIQSADGDAGTMRGVLTHVVPALDNQRLVAMLEPMVGDDSTGQVGMALLGSLFREDKYEQCIDTAERIGDMTERAGESAETQRQRLLALAYAEMEQYDKAEAAYRKILAMNEDDVLALNNLAFLLANDMDQPKKALPLAERAVELVGAQATSRANVLDTLGRIQYRLGDHRAAVETLRQSINAQPLVDNHLHLAEVYRAMDLPNSAQREINNARLLAEESEDPKLRERVENAARLLDGAAANAEEVTP